jgi:hypothetical protein
MSLLGSCSCEKGESGSWGRWKPLPSNGQWSLRGFKNAAVTVVVGPCNRLRTPQLLLVTFCECSIKSITMQTSSVVALPRDNVFWNMAQYSLMERNVGNAQRTSSGSKAIRQETMPYEDRKMLSCYRKLIRRFLTRCWNVIGQHEPWEVGRWLWATCRNVASFPTPHRTPVGFIIKAMFHLRFPRYLGEQILVKRT